MSNVQCRVIGLTGPIGSGKSEVAKILRRHGAFVIDADEVAHTLYNPQSQLWQELVKAFGSKILLRGGKINRKKLGEIVFSDKKLLKKLNEIVHPHLKEAIIKKVESSKSLVESGKLIVVNAALPQLFEGIVDEVWVVVASKEKRLKRLLKAGLSKKEAQKRIKAQTSQKEYLKIADKVIKNEGTLKQLQTRLQI